MVNTYRLLLALFSNDRICKTLEISLPVLVPEFFQLQGG